MCTCRRAYIHVSIHLRIYMYTCMYKVHVHAQCVSFSTHVWVLACIWLYVCIRMWVNNVNATCLVYTFTMSSSVMRTVQLWPWSSVNIWRTSCGQTSHQIELVHVHVYTSHAHLYEETMAVYIYMYMYYVKCTLHDNMIGTVQKL